jgi:general secretion pathway protein E/type IV pilus assembly protein PilB
LTANDEYIVQVLVEHGLLNYRQAEDALKAARKEDLPVIDILVRDTPLSQMDILRTLAQHFGMETISLSQLAIPSDVIAAVPPKIARRYNVVPFAREDNTLKVAISDPFDVDTLDSLRYLLKTNVEGAVAAPEEIKIALDHYYPLTRDELTGAIVDATQTTTSTQVEVTDRAEVAAGDEPIIKLVNLIIVEAFRRRASDIHLEPLEKKFRVRYRIDGVLHEVESPPRRLQAAIISRVKLMAGMSIAEKRLPQDGRIQINVMGRDLDLRVSCLPANHGETIVMRILDKSSLLLGLPQLGFFGDDQATFERLINLSDGIILITGPTGSGKTTTLYAVLNQLNKPDRKIITVEDPVEYQISGINQVQVMPEIGMTFAAALRAILRQAPNIIMIGEIRDLETAEIAVNASLTGHLVFSTLHTNDAPSAVIRLVDIGVKPFLVASSTRAVMAQRLVRRICPRCKEPYTPTEHEMKLLGPAAAQLEHAVLYRGKGCSDCNMTGYRGRLGIFEIFVLDDDVRHMINAQVSAAELRNAARRLGMRTLREDGLRKVVAGITTLEEVFRVTMGDRD